MSRDTVTLVFQDFVYRAGSPHLYSILCRGGPVMLSRWPAPWMCTAAGCCGLVSRPWATTLELRFSQVFGALDAERSSV